MPLEFTGYSIGFFLTLGVLAGILSATFGIGSGIIIVPALSFLASMQQKEAQGIALAVMVPMALMGAIRYHMNPDIYMDYRIVLLLAAAVVIGANIGASVAARLSNRTLQFGFALILFAVGFRMIWSSLKTVQ